VPITPFHFGPGFLLHSAAPQRVSFIAFVGANGITDVESIYNILSGNFPVHRFLHTFVGATLVTALTVMLFMAVRRLSRSVSLPNWFEWQQLSLAAVVTGATLGAFSHIVLDGIMHADMHPLAPWSRANPFLHIISLNALHWTCIISGAAGVLIWLKTRPSPPKSASPHS
jgi:membrane-bound metal-dependent hydrolase YbcI (DUF457 family)